MTIPTTTGAGDTVHGTTDPITIHITVHGTGAPIPGTTVHGTGIRGIMTRGIIHRITAPGTTVPIIGIPGGIRIMDITAIMAITGMDITAAITTILTIMTDGTAITVPGRPAAPPSLQAEALSPVSARG